MKAGDEQRTTDERKARAGENHMKVGEEQMKAGDKQVGEEQMKTSKEQRTTDETYARVGKEPMKVRDEERTTDVRKAKAEIRKGLFHLQCKQTHYNKCPPFCLFTCDVTSRDSFLPCDWSVGDALCCVTDTPTL